MDSFFQFGRPTGPAPAKSAPLADTSPPPDVVSTSTNDTNWSASFQSLPPEIHVMIAKELIYPDALSLKHTNRYFNHMVDTGVRLKVEWLMERRMLHLECPNNTRCDLGSDLRFCRGSVAYVFSPPPRP